MKKIDIIKACSDLGVHKDGSHLGPDYILKNLDLNYVNNIKEISKIDCIKDNGRPLALPYMGAIHISQAKKDYLEKLSDAFRIGDIVQAKVVKITGDNVDLGTVDEDCGVLKAMCTRCRDYMHTTQKENELQCNTCNKKERRKVSKNYVND